MALTRRKVEDATVWIGYADFLTTLAVLFFVLVVFLAGKAATGPAVVSGSVTHALTSEPLANCTLAIGERDSVLTKADGSFAVDLADIGRRLAVAFAVSCSGYAREVGTVSIASRDTTTLNVQLDVATKISVAVIPGDVLFDEDSDRLKPNAVNEIRRLGVELKQSLRAGQMIAVQGHSDDLPFAASSGGDNWSLSGQRAAAAARVLTDPAFGVRIDRCQVVIMGFGPSRPLQAVTYRETRAQRDEKRRINRRIEFRRVDGTGLAGGECQ